MLNHNEWIPELNRHNWFARCRSWLTRSRAGLLFDARKKMWSIWSWHGTETRISNPQLVHQTSGLEWGGGLPPNMSNVHFPPFPLLSPGWYLTVGGASLLSHHAPVSHNPVTCSEETYLSWENQNQAAQQNMIRAVSVSVRVQTGEEKMTGCYAFITATSSNQLIK